MNRRLLLTAGGVFVILLAAGWALFRPELLFIDKSVNESFPGASVPSAAAPSESTAAGGSTTLRSGMFHGVAHETRGTASIHQLAGGKRVLRFTGFETSNGPDLRVLLVAAEDAADNDAVKNGMPIELGKLKGNVGDQNYDVPSSADLGKYRAVSVWCHRFGVNFATAPLK